VDPILTNLVSNAVRATAAGGTVTLTAVTGRGEAGVAVHDTGSGIAPEHLPYIFDRLYRVQAGRDRAAGGSGLGLAIVRRLATLLGGRVAVESTPGDGSTFTLWLPASAVAPPPPSRVGSEPL
jgi:signal transduction histidine kinase